ncbi:MULTISPECIES: Holliday junction branch migration protein RuvA [Bacillus]|uniref:Holliday junction branch migration complex subunit RuvA n=1 Tax=Bacillus vallismortis TaxID=72361 RepID=A0AAP3CJZ3_BACVA|nr:MULTISPECIES: Holliday junction branch migration protein RuvA [Bacillus]MBG9771053.1 ATP-dependent DNA helicase RuvA [Bacillus vallismortis]MCI3983751.1 Holliday junction branch migration protein RuvA [Bacillus vallismortis]MCI4137968.1 Holliday junction branch migration protein RuvA [Bacillus vallismortis]MCO4849889.1 Holliday junction branch migration protein RuvA [Bacillus vallismortis]MCY7893516.1 Holliday junction branch migration protein RuvA [Bacillus vallismortis]
MIEFVKGTIDYVSPQYIVIENGGIGYQIFTPNPFIYKERNKETIFTYHHIREDAFSLYGFSTREEKALFTKLLNVTGIGPKGALAILGSGDPGAVIQAIENEDEAFLVKFPGVGKKTARQIILDLKGKLADVVPEMIENLFNHEERLEKQTAETALEEALEALRVLGYAEKEIKKVLPHLNEEAGLTTDQYVKKALQKLLK